MKKIISLLLTLSIISSLCINVFAQDASNNIQINAVCNKVGNCFVEGEEVAFDVSLKNLTSDTAKVLIDANAESSYGTVYRHKTETVEFQPNSEIVKQIKFNIKEKNTYTLHISLKTEAGEEFQAYELPFSYVEKAKEYNGDSIFGVCINMGNLSGKNLTDECDMLAMTGIQYGRDNLYWSNVEVEQGKYNFYGDKFIDELISRGIKPLICLGYGNKYYADENADVPKDEAGYAAFGKYAAALAEHYKGKIAAFEVWNEWNGGGWSRGGTDEDYVELLKHAYENIKEVDPDVPVLCGGAITVAYDWFPRLYKLGALDYCDGISYHPYNYPTDPDQKAYQGNVEDNFEQSYQLMKQYGTPKPQWYTEWGWYTGTDGGNVDEKTQAEYMVRGYASGMAYGVEKIFYYTFKDVGAQTGYSEHNYGLIKNSTDSAEVKYEPKQSFVAVTAAGNKLKGAKFVKEYRPLPDARVFQYERDGKDVIVMYYVKENATTNTSVRAKVTGSTAQMQMYDMFGNEIDGIDILDGSPVYIEGEKGQFNINDICLSKRNSVQATFGYWRTQDGIYVSEHHAQDTKSYENCYTIGKGYEFDNILCDVDDGYICGGSNDVAVDVRYYDYGSASFCLEYKSANGTVKQTKTVKQSRTNNWKTERLYINDAAFDNSLDGKDLRIKLINPTGTAMSFYGVRIAKTEDIEKRTMSVSFDDDRQFTDLSGTGVYYYPVKGDGCTAYLADQRSPFEYTEKDGRKGIYVTAQGNALFMLVDADDDILYGNFYPVKVSVDYFDEGSGKFAVAYDVGNYTNFGETPSVTLGNTKTWKTAEFTLSKCWWQNHENSLSDISVQLWAPSMGMSSSGIVFGKIKIEVLDGASEKDKPLKAIVNQINSEPTQLENIVKQNFDALNIDSAAYRAASENNLLSKGFELCQKDIPYNNIKNEDITEFQNSIKLGMTLAVFNGVNDNDTLAEVVDDSADVLKLEREKIYEYWTKLSVEQKLKVCDNIKKNGYESADDIKYDLIENIILYQLLNASNIMTIPDLAKSFTDLYETKIYALSEIDYSAYDALSDERQTEVLKELKKKSSTIKTLSDWKEEFNTLSVKWKTEPLPERFTIAGVLKPGYIISVENDIENSTCQWYRCESLEDEGTPIEGATSASYTIKDADGGKYLKFIVKNETGEIVGRAISAQVAEALKNTFSFGEILTGWSPAKTPDENVFYVDGRKFILLDTEGETSYIYADEVYAYKGVWGWQMLKPDYSADPNILGYWLQHAIIDDNFPNEQPLYKLPKSIIANIDYDHVWLTEGAAADGPCPENYTYKAGVSLLSLEELRKYGSKIGYGDINVRTLRTGSNINANCMVCVNVDGVIRHVGIGDFNAIVPSFYVNNDFFKTTKLDVSTMGDNVKATMRQMYSETEMSAIYSKSELEEIGYGKVAEVKGTLKPGYTVTASFISKVDSYNWYRCDSATDAGTQIDGVTGTEYTLKNADGGKYIKVEGVKNGVVKETIVSGRVDEALANSFNFGEVLTGWSPAKTPDENVFYVDGRKFILLDTEGETSYIYADEVYAYKGVWGWQMLKPDYSADPNILGYWLQHAIIDDNFPNEQPLYKLPKSIIANIDYDHVWLTEGAAADGPCPENYTYKAGVSLLSLEELRKYGSKIGYGDINVRTLRTGSNINANCMVCVNVDGVIRHVGIGDVNAIVPSFYVNNDFFKTTKLDVSMMGDNVKAAIRQMYSMDNLVGLYSKSELAQLGYDVENAGRIINNIKFTDENGNSIHHVSDAGNTLNVSAFVANYDKETAITMIAAVYDEQGQLIAMSMKSANAESGQEFSIDISVNLKDVLVKSGYTSKVYFWNDISGMCPLREKTGI